MCLPPLTSTLQVSIRRPSLGQSFILLGHVDQHEMAWLRCPVINHWHSVEFLIIRPCHFEFLDTFGDRRHLGLDDTFYNIRHAYGGGGEA